MFEAISAVNKILDGRQKAQLVLLVLLMLVTAILETLGISLVIPYIAAVVQPEQLLARPVIVQLMGVLGITNTKELLIALTVFSILVYVVKNAMLYCVNVLRVRFVSSNRLALTNRLMLSLLNEPYYFYLQSDSSQLASLLTNDVLRIYELISAILHIVTEIFVVTAILTLLCIVDWQVTLTFLVMFGLLFIFLEKAIKPCIAKLGAETRQSWQNYVKIIAEIFGGIKEIKVQQSAADFYGQFVAAGEKNVEMDSRRIWFTAIPQAVTELACVGGVLFVMLVHIIQDSFNPDFLAVVSLFALASIRLVPSSNRIHGALNTIIYNLTNLLSVQIRLANLEGKAGLSVPEKKQVYQLQREIRFSQVSFAYPNRGEVVLDKADMVIQKGSKVGIIGTTGSGKTTTMNLLLGLLLPSGGRILVDGEDVRDLRREKHLQIGFVPQDIFLLNDSVAANVAFGRTMDRQAVAEVLKKAELYDFVVTLPKGMDTTVGERGVRLSGGQRQRLGIARALYGNPEVLLCDEATSALDNDTEQDVIKSIYALGEDHTLIMIAHRLTTIAYCDVVYKVEGGKIVDCSEQFFKEYVHKN